MPDSNERVLAMLIYLLSFVFPIIAPLIIWLVKRDDSAFIDYHGKEYFNFFISYVIYSGIALVLILLLIGIILLPIVGLASIILSIVAAVKALDGVEYRIPFIFRLIK